MKRKSIECKVGYDEDGNCKIIKWEEGWSYILTCVNELKKYLEGETKPVFDAYQSMELYSTIYNMCVQKPPYDYPQKLYNKYCETIQDYVTETVLSLTEKHDEYMLKELAQRWSNHKVMVSWLSRYFRYLERYYLAKEGPKTLEKFGMTCFRNLVYKKIRSKAKEAILALIQRERDGEEIDRGILKNVLDVYVENGMGKMKNYEDDIERFMLQDTATYYSRKASSWIQDDSSPEYMLKAEEYLKKERESATQYLHSKTVPKLLEIVQNELLLVFAKQLLENEHSGCLALLRDNKMDDLSTMCRLYHSFPQWLRLIADLFKKHVTEESTTITKQVEDAATNQDANTCGVEEKLVRLQVLIGIVIKLHNKYMVYVTQCFQNRLIFHKALQEVFEIVCNKKLGGSSSAELIATFCDNILKKGGSEKLSDEDIEAKLEDIVKFLVYTNEKDLFAEFYTKKLASRLLFDRSGNDEHERSLLTKLKEEFGWVFTSKMESMVMDMTLARESKNNFGEYLATNKTTNLGIDLTVTVLTAGFWPSYRTCDLNLPSEMVKSVEVFKAFYKTKTKHRKLRWIHSLGTCYIIGKFDEKPIELIVNTYQAAVLLLFNNTERLSYNEMLEQLNLSHGDLMRLLHSLSCAKYKILAKEPMSKNISRADVFEFNSKFINKLRRIKIPLSPMDERNKVVEDVDRDRRYAIDASIVRIMKSRKRFGHQQLVSECIEHLSRTFKPDIKIIKKRIGDLINRDYLERDNENPKILKYIA